MDFFSTTSTTINNNNNNNNNQEEETREGGGGLSEHLLGNNNNNNEKDDAPLFFSSSSASLHDSDKNNNNNNNKKGNGRFSWNTTTTSTGGVHYGLDDNDAEAQQALTAPVDPTTASAVQVGQTQPPRWRDAWAALLFMIKQGFILYLAIQWGYPHWKVTVVTDGEYQTIKYGAMWHLVALVTTLAIGTGTITLVLLTRIAKHNYLIPASLLTTCVLQVVLALWFGIAQRSVVGAVLAAGMALITILYTRAVWHRTALAASQLQTSLIALQTNGSVMFVAVGMTIACTLWLTIWMLAVLGVATRHLSTTTTTTTTTTGDDADRDSGYTNSNNNVHVSVAATVLLLLSLFWTTEVSKNIVHVTTAGTVGTWWFSPDDAAGFWSPAVRDSWSRAVTYSFGSICLGSLWTAMFHVLHTLARLARRHGNSSSRAGPSMLLCVLECLLRCTERLLTYFNKWAFVYVGLYGYDYLTAGQKVVRLFQERGWTTIIQDDLIQRALQLVTLALGLATAALGVLFATWHPSWVAAWGNAVEEDSTGDNIPTVSHASLMAAFLVSLLVGSAVGHLLLSVVASAVDTVLVAWAEAPLELERHYPGLYAAQVAAWRQAYPEEFGM